MPWNPWESLRSVARTLWPQPDYIEPNLSTPSPGPNYEAQGMDWLAPVRPDPEHERRLAETAARIAEMKRMLAEAQAPMPEATPLPKVPFVDEPGWGQDARPSLDDQLQRIRTDSAARLADLEDLQKRLQDASDAAAVSTGTRPKPVDWQSAVEGWNFQPPTPFTALVQSAKPEPPQAQYPGPLGGFGEWARETTHEALRGAEPIAAQFPQPPRDIPGLAPEGMINRAGRAVQGAIAQIPTFPDLIAGTVGGAAGMIEQGARLSPFYNPAIYRSPVNLAGETKPGENEVLSAVAQFVSGGFEAATPLIVAQLAINPVATVRALGTFGVSESVITALAQKAGVSEEVSRLIGLAAAVPVAHKIGKIGQEGKFDDIARYIRQREDVLTPNVIPPKPPGWTPKSRLAGAPPSAAPAAAPAPQPERFVGRPERGAQPNLQTLTDEDLRVNMMRAVTEGRDAEAEAIGVEMDRREAGEPAPEPAPATEPFVYAAPTAQRPGGPVQPPLTQATPETAAYYSELERIIAGVEAGLPPEMLGRPAPRAPVVGEPSPARPPGVVYETPTGPQLPLREAETPGPLAQERPTPPVRPVGEPSAPKPPGFVYNVGTEPARGHLQEPLREAPAGERVTPPVTPPPPRPVEPPPPPAPVAAPPVAEPVRPAPPPTPAPAAPPEAVRTARTPIPGTTPRPDLAATRPPEGNRPQEYVEVTDPNTLQLDPRTYQHKESDVRGVTGKLKDVNEWNEDSPPIMIHVRDVTGNGARYVADGHQRYNLYRELLSRGKRLPPLIAQVKRESEGWTVERVRRAAALKNIIEPTTDAYDIAKVLRSGPLNDRERNMVTKSGVTAKNLSTGEALSTLGEDAFQLAVSNKAIPADQGALIGKYITDPGQQARAVVELQKRNFANAKEAETFLIELADTPFVQPDLFGALPGMEAEGVLSAVDQKFDLINRMSRSLRRRVSAFSNLLRNAQAVSDAGNVLAGETNKSIADETRSLLGYFEKYKNAKGTRTRQAINDYAERIARGESTPADAEEGILAALRADIESGPPPEPVAAPGRPPGAGGLPKLAEREQGAAPAEQPRVEPPTPTPPPAPEAKRLPVDHPVLQAIYKAVGVTVGEKGPIFRGAERSHKLALDFIEELQSQVARGVPLETALKELTPRGRSLEDVAAIRQAALDALKPKGIDEVLRPAEPPAPPVQPRPPEVDLTAEREAARKTAEPIVERAREVAGKRRPITGLSREQRSELAFARNGYLDAAAKAGLGAEVESGLKAMDAAAYDAFQRGGFEALVDVYRKGLSRIAQRTAPTPPGFEPWVEGEMGRYVAVKTKAGPAVVVDLNEGQTHLSGELKKAGFRFDMKRTKRWYRDYANDAEKQAAVADAERILNGPRKAGTGGPSEVERILGIGERGPETPSPGTEAPPPPAPAIDSRISGLPPEGERRAVPRPAGRTAEDAAFEAMREKLARGERVGSEEGRKAFDARLAADKIRAEAEEKAAAEHGTAPRGGKPGKPPTAPSAEGEAPLEPGRVVKNEFGEEEPMLPGGMEDLAKTIDRDVPIVDPAKLDEMIGEQRLRVQNLEWQVEEASTRAEKAEMQAKLDAAKKGLSDLERLAGKEEPPAPTTPKEPDLFADANADIPTYDLKDVGKVEPAEEQKIREAEAKLTKAEQNEPPRSLEDIGRVTPEEAARAKEAARIDKEQEPNVLDLRPTSKVLKPHEREFLRARGKLTDAEIDAMTPTEARAKGQEIGARLKAEKKAADEAAAAEEQQKLDAKQAELAKRENFDDLDPRARAYWAFLEYAKENNWSAETIAKVAPERFKPYFDDRVKAVDDAVRRHNWWEQQKQRPATLGKGVDFEKAEIIQQKSAVPDAEMLALKTLNVTDAEAHELIDLKAELADRMAKNRLENERRTKDDQAIDTGAPTEPFPHEKEAFARARAEWLQQSTPESLERYGESLARFQEGEFRAQTRNKLSAEKEQLPAETDIENPFRKFWREEKGTLDFSALAELKKNDPAKFWRVMNWVAGPLTGGTIGAATDPDDPINGFLRGAIAGRLLTSKGLWDRQARQQWIKYGKAITKLTSEPVPRGQLPKLRYERNLNEDIGFIERFLPLTPERTVRDIHRAAWTILSELRRAEEYGIETPHGRFDLRPLIKRAEAITSTPAGKTDALAARKQLDRIHRAYVGDAVKEIRRMADEAEKAGFTNKAAYARNLADYLGRKPTAFQRGVKKGFKNLGIDVPYDVVEKTFGQNVYRIGIGWALDSATQNLTQPTLALRFVRVRDILHGYRMANTPEGRATTTHLVIRRPIDVDDAGAPLPAKEQMGGLRGAWEDKTRLMAKTDNFNRRVVYHASLNYARDKFGITGKYADDWAQGVVRATQADSGPLSFNPHYRGPVGGSLRPYMKWPGLLVENVLDIMAQPDKSRRTEAVLALMGVVLAGRAIGIDLEDVLLMGGRPLGVDVMHPAESAQKIVTGQTTPVGRTIRDLVSHAGGTATHSILPQAATVDEFLQSDLSYLALGRYPTKVAQTAVRTARADVEPMLEGRPREAHMKRTPSGSPNPVSALEDLVNLTGFKSPRQTSQEKLFREAGREVGEDSAKRRADLQTIRRLWQAAMDSGDTERADELMGMLTSIQSARTMVRGTTQTRFEKLLRSASPQIRDALEREYGERFRRTQLPER